MPVSDFRPIYYLGCKTSFAEAIKIAIDDVDPSGGRLCDLFAGTGAVSAAVGVSREVTAVDIQEYSRVICAAVLKPAKLTTKQILSATEEVAKSQKTAELLRCLKPLIAYERDCIVAASEGNAVPLVELLESPALTAYQMGETPDSRLGQAMRKVADCLQAAGLWQSPDTTVTRHFGGIYFSFTQSVMLDGMLSLADSPNADAGNTLKAAALSTASQIVNTVGKQFAQPLRPRNKSGEVKPGLVKIVQRDRVIDALGAYLSWLGKYAALKPAVGKPECIRADYLQGLGRGGIAYSVCYADPPYTRDHYSRFYHVLETMCLRDDPDVSSVKKNGEVTASRGLYRQDRHQSPFCIRSAAPGAFDALFRATRERNVPLVLSYSPHESGDGTHPRVVSMNMIIDLAKCHYDRVEIMTIDGSIHNNLNRIDLKLKTREHAEVIVKCYC